MSCAQHCYFLSWFNLFTMSCSFVVDCAILCSICASTLDAVGDNCATTPPEPQRCSSDYCIIAKEYDQQGNLEKIDDVIRLFDG